MISRIRARWINGVIIAVSAIIGGCNIVAPAFYLIHGPPRTPAMYELEDRTTVVFVDDRSNIIDRGSDQLRRRIANRTSVDLMKKKILTVTIRPQDAMALAKRNDRHNDIMPIDAIGRAVGAEQIIYVQMLQFKESPDGVTPRPLAACQVKVIDCISREKLFPAGADSSYPLNVAMPPINMENYADANSRMVVLEMLAEKTGEEIGKLFYEHETVELGSNLEPR